ncbi:MAG TPA: peptidoglycan editing factor PgeF [Vicinamibacterales bacterium]|nr:peptidoglycan editing factor PgeF [Vicinamibacterales bacterium]
MQLAAGPALVCDALEPFAHHFFTTRPWRLGERSTDVRGGWEEVAAAAGVAPGQLRHLHQVHGCDVAMYRRGNTSSGDPPKADITLTDDGSLALAVQTADCLPLLVVDRATRAVAAAHAGWRGLAGGVPAKVVIEMASALHGRAEDLLVAIGPAIGPCCYEVGEDVRSKFVDGWPLKETDRWFRVEPAALAINPSLRSLAPGRRADRWFFDIWTCVRDTLEQIGVDRENIFTANLCTASHESLFCSYRRDGAVAGRMAAVIKSRK